jgi:hypothetical protein
MQLAINNIESNTADGVVTTVHWTAKVEDGEFVASSYGSASFTRDDDSASLIPFDSLTEADVVGWVTASLDPDMEANLTAQIEDQKAPTTSFGMPWAPEEVVVEDVVV